MELQQEKAASSMRMWLQYVKWSKKTQVPVLSNHAKLAELLFFVPLLLMRKIGRKPLPHLTRPY